MRFNDREKQYLRLKLHCDLDYVLKHPCKDAFEQLTEDLLLAAITLKLMGKVKELLEVLNGVDLMTVVHDELVKKKPLDRKIAEAITRSVNVVDREVSKMDAKLYKSAMDMI